MSNRLPPGTRPCPDEERDLFYEAVRSRDRRFDGRFFTAVTTTSIYCRPICPAPTPKRENVRFFPCAAAAEAAGFRPCRRCRPESSPGTPAWIGTPVTVARALRLIAAGDQDGENAGDLAERLGVGERHLRRLFRRHLGATPGQLARCHRVHFARRLIDETALPMHEIAVTSGFGSLRRFNAAIQATFGRSPSELRRLDRETRSPERRRRIPRDDTAARTGSGRAGSSPSGEGSITLRLAYRPPLEWSLLLGFLRQRAIPGVEIVNGETYRRTVRLGAQAALFEATCLPDVAVICIRISPGVRSELLDVALRTRRLFDLDADPLVISSHLGGDALLSGAVRLRPGLRLPGAWDPFEIAVRGVLGQQVSVAAATTLAGRLVDALGDRMDDRDGDAPSRLFPSAEQIAGADLRSIGLPRTRAAALRELARRVRDREISFSGGANPVELRESLMAIPGIGSWTADYVLLRGLGEPDVFLPGDLGVRRALGTSQSGLPSAVQAARRAEIWRPWRAYALIHLWTGAGHDPAPGARGSKETLE